LDLVPLGLGFKAEGSGFRLSGFLLRGLGFKVLGIEGTGFRLQV
jgi:hypothetical protein